LSEQLFLTDPDAPTSRPRRSLAERITEAKLQIGLAESPRSL
jgi:hypothetical protein